MASVLTQTAPIFTLDIPIENESYVKENNSCSLWLQKGQDYVPSVEVKVLPQIPSGIYKVVSDPEDEYHVVPVKSNTDELYEFSEDFTSIILKEIENFWSRRKTYNQYHLTHKRGLLLAGKPGTGKTACINLLIKQLIEKENGLVFIINSVKDFQNYCDFLKPMLRKIELDRPIVTIIEDIDQLIDAIGRDSEILDLLDGKNSIDNHLIILTSNDTSNLSPALLRPSRIDLFYEIPAPSKTTRCEFFKRKGVKEEDLELFTDLTEDMTFAELKEVFIGTYILGKNVESVIAQIKQPFETKDYLTTHNKIKI